MRIEYVKNIPGFWVATWTKNCIYLHKDIKKYDKRYAKLIVLHEATERFISRIINVPDCCSSKYIQEIHGNKNLFAHNFATVIEFIYAQFLHVNWKKYSFVVNMISFSAHPNIDHEDACASCYKSKTCKNKE